MSSKLERFLPKVPNYYRVPATAIAIDAGVVITSLLHGVSQVELVSLLTAGVGVVGLATLKARSGRIEAAEAEEQEAIKGGQVWAAQRVDEYFVIDPEHGMPVRPGQTWRYN